MEKNDMIRNFFEGENMSVVIHYMKDPEPEIIDNVQRVIVYFTGNGSGILIVRHHGKKVAYYRLKGVRKWEVTE